jgi:hypothetical protein
MRLKLALIALVGITAALFVLPADDQVFRTTINAVPVEYRVKRILLDYAADGTLSRVCVQYSKRVTDPSDGELLTDKMKEWIINRGDPETWSTNEVSVAIQQLWPMADGFSGMVTNAIAHPEWMVSTNQLEIQP